jgi:hypothetical protein
MAKSSKFKVQSSKLKAQSSKLKAQSKAYTLLLIALYSDYLGPARRMTTVHPNRIARKIINCLINLGSI